MTLWCWAPTNVANSAAVTPGLAVMLVKTRPARADGATPGIWPVVRSQDAVVLTCIVSATLDTPRAAHRSGVEVAGLVVRIGRTRSRRIGAASLGMSGSCGSAGVGAASAYRKARSLNFV